MRANGDAVREVDVRLITAHRAPYNLLPAVQYAEGQPPIKSGLALNRI
jgi:hypothetical protein